MPAEQPAVILDAVAKTGRNVAITDAITGGSLERTIEGASTLTLDVHDPHRKLLRNELTKAFDLKYAGVWWRLVKIAKSGEKVTLTFEDRDVSHLRGHAKPRKVSRNKMTRAQFVRSLVREVKASPIKFYCPEVNERQEIAGSKSSTGEGARGKQILHVGDSLAVGTHPNLDKLVGATDYDGLVGRSSTATLTRLQAMLKPSHRVVIFDAGSNDTDGATLKANLEDAKAAAGTRPVYALTVNSPPNTAELNKAINDAGVRVIDWHGYVVRNNLPLDGMGIHPDADGYRRRAKLIAGALGGSKKTPDAPSKRTESDRDAKRQKGLAEGARLTVKGVAATPEQRRNMERVLDVADSLKAGPKATKALVEAVIVESTVKNLSGGDRDSIGILQVRVSTSGSAAKSANIEWCVKQFLTVGFYTDPELGGGGAMAIARRHPEATAGRIAQATQGSGVPDAYDKYADEADGWLDAYGGASGNDSGGTDVAASTRRKYEFTRGQAGKPEDSWTAIARLAEEVQWRAFMDRGTLYFVSEDELMKAKARYVINEDVAGVHWIDFDIDQGKLSAQVQVACRSALFDIPIGSVIAINETGIANGRWLVASVSQDVFANDTTLTLKAPTPKLPEPAAETTTPSGGSGGKPQGDDEGGKGSLRERIVAAAEKTLTVHTGHNYYLAGGQTTTDPLAKAPLRSDCSQWVRAIYMRCGCPDPGGNTVAMMAKAKRTSTPRPGDILVSSHHVEMFVSGDTTYGHGSPPIDKGSVAYHKARGCVFMTYDFLDS